MDPILLGNPHHGRIEEPGGYVNALLLVFRVRYSEVIG